MTSDTWTKAAPLSALKEEGRLVFRKEGPPDRVVRHVERSVRLQQPLPTRGLSAARGRPRQPVHPHLQLAQLEVRPAKRQEPLRRRGIAHLPGGGPRRGGVDRPCGAATVSERRAGILASLREAAEDNAYDRMAREIARLHRLGADPLDALRDAIDWSWERMEFGWTHAYAGLADWLTLYDEYEDNDEIRLACVLEGFRAHRRRRAARAAPSLPRRSSGLGRRGVRRRGGARGRDQRGGDAARRPRSGPRLC